METAAVAKPRYVIKLRRGMKERYLKAELSAIGGDLVRFLPQVDTAIAVSSAPGFPGAAASLHFVKTMGALPAFKVGPVEKTAPCNVTPTTGLSSSRDGPTATDYLYNSGLVWGVERVHAPKAWEAGHVGSHNTTVAVLDTGVAYNHPDLKENVVDKQCFTSASDTASGKCLPYPSLDGHGTHVAGTIAAAFDGGAVVGVAPKLGIASYNVFEEVEECGVCAYPDSIWAAMLDAAGKGYQVISMSLGGLSFRGGNGTDELNAFFQAERKVASYVARRGTSIFAAAGNHGLDLNGNLINTPSDLAFVSSVGASAIRPGPPFRQGYSQDTLAWYSNTGAPVTFSAPGGDCGTEGPEGCISSRLPWWILSTYVLADPACAATASCLTGYAWSIGTSMAVPHASAVAGLLRDAEPQLKPNQVEARLKLTADKQESRLGFGHGIINAAAALGV